jgi:hypothetical protein
MTKNGTFEVPLTAEEMGISDATQTTNFDSTTAAIIGQKDALQEYFDVLQGHSYDEI